MAKNQISVRLEGLKKASPNLVKKALGQVGLRLIRDTVIESPRPPLNTGLLRGSGAVYIEEKLLLTSDKVGGNSGAVKGQVPGTNPDSSPLELTIVFNTPYAAIMDQDLAPEGKGYQSRFANDNQIGGGFLSKKVSDPKLHKVYMEIAAKAIGQELDSISIG